MKITVALDNDLVRTAQELAGVTDKTALLRDALKALIERESARRLASLGGTMGRLKNNSPPKNSGARSVLKGRGITPRRKSHRINTGSSR